MYSLYRLYFREDHVLPKKKVKLQRYKGYKVSIILAHLLILYT